MPKGKRHKQLAPLAQAADFGDLVPDSGPDKRGLFRRAVKAPDELPDKLKLGKPTPVYDTGAGHGKYESA